MLRYNYVVEASEKGKNSRVKSCLHEVTNRPVARSFVLIQDFAENFNFLSTGINDVVEQEKTWCSVN